MKKNTKKFPFRKYGWIKNSLFIVLIIQCGMLIPAFSQIKVDTLSEDLPVVKPDTISSKGLFVVGDDENGFRNIEDDLKLSKKDMVAFNTRARQKVDEFTSYLSIVASKTESNINRDMAIKNALKLFIPDAIVQVAYKSKTGKKVYNRPIPKYLHRLKMLKGYTKVELKFYDLTYITKLEKAPDGTFRATATFYQVFTGYVGDKIKYNDKEKKTIEIILKMEEDPFYNERRWTLYLGNIKVAETEK